jgi:peptidoglycan/LPS O-acetylase OafA/YrhL
MIQGESAHVLAGIDTHADALMLGCSVALLEPKYGAIVGWLGVAAILLLSTAWEFGPSPVFAQLSLVTMATVASTVAVAACPMALSWRPLAAVGKISYGLYLWHGIIVWYLAPWPITIAASFAAAIASWLLVERPFLTLKRHFSRVSPRGGKPAEAATEAEEAGKVAIEGTPGPVAKPTAALGG